MSRVSSLQNKHGGARIATSTTHRSSVHEYVRILLRSQIMSTQLFLVLLLLSSVKSTLLQLWLLPITFFL